MTLTALLDIPGVEDVIATSDTLFVITTGTQTPTIYSDKAVEYIRPQDLLVHKQLGDILSGESVLHGGRLHLQTMILYEYDAKKATASNRQSLSHELFGTGGRKSLVEAVGGRRVGKTAFIVPLTAQEEVEALLKARDARIMKTRIACEVKK